MKLHFSRASVQREREREACCFGEENYVYVDIGEVGKVVRS
jgi:hypothetical protein